MAFKIGNEYARMFDGGLYDATPKAVFAAIVASVMSTGGDFPEEAVPNMLKEWDILNQCGIVKQPVPERYRHLIPEK